MPDMVVTDNLLTTATVIYGALPFVLMGATVLGEIRGVLNRGGLSTTAASSEVWHIHHHK